MAAQLGNASKSAAGAVLAILRFASSPPPLRRSSPVESIFLEALLEQAEELRRDLQQLLSAVEIDAATGPKR